MEVKLVVVGGAHDGRVIPVRRAKYIIGRSKECQLRPGCNLVSRRHCVLLLQDGHVVVEDLRSTNGTVVNGEKIENPRELTHGDHLHVGSMEFELRMFDEVEKEPEPEPSEDEDVAAGPTMPTPVADAEPKNDFPGDESEWEVAGLDEAANELAKATQEEKKPAKAKGEADEFDISNWFGDDGDDLSGDGDADGTAESDSKLPDTASMPQAADSEIQKRAPEKKNGSVEKKPGSAKAVDPPQKTVAAPVKKKDCSQTAANDVLDMMSRFVPKKK